MVLSEIFSLLPDASYPSFGILNPVGMQYKTSLLSTSEWNLMHLIYTAAHLAFKGNKRRFVLKDIAMFYR